MYGINDFQTGFEKDLKDLKKYSLEESVLFWNNTPCW